MKNGNCISVGLTETEITTVRVVPTKFITIHGDYRCGIRCVRRRIAHEQICLYEWTANRGCCIDRSTLYWWDGRHLDISILGVPTRKSL